MRNSSAQSQVDFLKGGGETGELIRSINWARTPLGALDKWPQPLRTSVTTALRTRFPILIWWGEDLTLIYNDAYIPIFAGKHPGAMGKPGLSMEGWGEEDVKIVIEPMLRGVMRSGAPTWSEDQLLVLERKGFPEETYFTWSYSPIQLESGEVGGVLTIVTETTARVLGQRRMNILRDLGEKSLDAKTLKGAYTNVIEVLQAHPLDIPFFLFYFLEHDDCLTLVGRSNLPMDEKCCPGRILLTDDAGDHVWPVAQVLATRKEILKTDLKESAGVISGGIWPEPCSSAFITPVIGAGQENPSGVLITGVSPRLAFDEDYRSFLKLLTDQIATAISHVQTLEAERKRAEALAELDRAKTIFFSNISHEFRTPLTLMLGPLEEMLENEKLDEQQARNLRTSYRNTLRLQKLVNTLLDFSRIETGHMHARFQMVDIVKLTQDLASNFRSAIEDAGMEYRVLLSETVPPVYVDPEMWEKIVLNLISNAIKYTHAGFVEVRLEASGEHMILHVADSGVGIQDADKLKIFERFYRAENALGRSQEGTGIGLSMVKELVQIMKGEIRVESTFGKGSVFSVSLPLGRNHLQASQIVPSESTSGSRKAAEAFLEEAYKWTSNNPASELPPLSDTPADRRQVLPSARILLADDNGDMREYVKGLLRPAFEVESVTNGEDAFKMALTWNPDLIISDMMMPLLDGYGLLRKLKQNLKTRNIPLVFLSARAGEEAKVEGINAGADEYLVKPFSAKELIARVTNQIAISRARRATEKQFYNLFLKSPAHIHVMRGPDHVFEFFHPLAIPFVGRDVTGLKAREAFPQIEGQGYFEMLDRVYQEGIMIQQDEARVVLPRENGETTEYFFNITYLPWQDPQGNIVGVLHFGFEVTDMVRQRKKAELSEQKFRSIAQQAPVSMAVFMGPTHRIEVVNARALELFRSTYDEVIHRPVLEAFPELAEQGFGEILAGVFETGRPFMANEMPVEVVRAGKSHMLYLNFIYEPFHNELGVIEGIMAIGIDVTEQVNAKRQLVANEERLRIATEILGLGTWEYDVLNGQSYLSAKTIELFGFPPGSAMGLQDAINAIVAEDRQRVQDAIEKAMNPVSGGKYDVEYSLINATDRIQRTVRANGQVFFGADDRPQRFLGTVLDITERKKTEQALRASEERFRLLATSVPQIVWTNDKTGNTDYISGQFEKFTGRKPEESYITWRELVHPDDRPALITKRNAAIQQGVGWEHEFRMQDTKTGAYRWFHGNSQPLRDADGNITMWIGAASDIQHLKEQSKLLEEQVQLRTQALHHLNQSLKISNEDLQQFAHVASHDLKEPIRKIKTYSNRLFHELGNLLPEQGSVFLSKILSATDRMYAMIDGVLLYSTIGATEQPTEPVDLNEVFRNITTDLEVLIQEKGAAIEYQRLPVVEGAPVLLYQLFFNLVNNSLKFSRDGVAPRVQVLASESTFEGRRYNKIRLRDNGIGFDPENAEKIFSTFTRLHSKDKYEGTGLGLALCKKIVLRHGGSIAASGEKNKGAEFTVLLPANT